MKTSLLLFCVSLLLTVNKSVCSSQTWTKVQDDVWLFAKERNSLFHTITHYSKMLETSFCVELCAESDKVNPIVVDAARLAIINAYNTLGKPLEPLGLGASNCLQFYFRQSDDVPRGLAVTGAIGRPICVGHSILIYYRDEEEMLHHLDEVQFAAIHEFTHLLGIIYKARGGGEYSHYEGLADWGAFCTDNMEFTLHSIADNFFQRVYNGVQAAIDSLENFDPLAGDTRDYNSVYRLLETNFWKFCLGEKHNPVQPSPEKFRLLTLGQLDPRECIDGWKRNVLPVLDSLLLRENFEGGIDPRISILHTLSTGNSTVQPGVVQTELFGSKRAFTFGRSMCSANCYNDNPYDRQPYVAIIRVNFGTAVYIKDISFSWSEVDGNWGSGGFVYLDASQLGQYPEQYIGISPPSNGVRDDTIRRWLYSVDTLATTVDIAIWDIANKSQIYLDDLRISGALGNTTGISFDTLVGDEFALQPNYPNPFQQHTTLGFTLPQPGSAVLSIYDYKSSLVKKIEYPYCSAGVHQVLWDGKDAAKGDVPKGLYYYTVTWNNRTLVGNMVLLR